METPDLKTILNDYYHKYLRTQKHRSHTTIFTYQQQLGTFYNWFTKEYPNLTVEDLDLDIVRAFQLFIINRNTKKSTQNAYTGALRAFLIYLSRVGIKSLDPYKIQTHKEKSSPRNYLNEEQRDVLFGVIDTSTVWGLRDRAIIELFYSTGLRTSELYKLNIDNVRNKTELQMRGKGNKYRPAFISDRAREWIDKYLETRTDSEKALFISYTIATVKNRRLSISSIERSIRKYGRDAKFPFDVTPMTLRHSFAAKLLQKNVNLRIIQEMLGHSSLATTEVYTSVSNTDLRDTYKLHYNEITSPKLQIDLNKKLTIEDLNRVIEKYNQDNPDKKVSLNG